MSLLEGNYCSENPAPELVEVNTLSQTHKGAVPVLRLLGVQLIGRSDLPSNL